MAAWIEKSLVGEDGRNYVPLDEAVHGWGYLDAMYQAALLLRGVEFWNRVAARLIADGTLDPSKHGRYTSGLDGGERS